MKLASQPLLPACPPCPRQKKSSRLLFAAPARHGGPLFSQPYELLFPAARRSLGGQALCFDNHLNCPGCGDLRALSWHSPLPSYFQQLAASFALPKKSTPLQSSKSSLFFKNTRVGGTRPAFSANLGALCASLPRASKGALSFGLFPRPLTRVHLFQLSTVDYRDFPSTMLKSTRTAYDHS